LKTLPIYGHNYKMRMHSYQYIPPKMLLYFSIPISTLQKISTLFKNDPIIMTHPLYGEGSEVI